MAADEELRGLIVATIGLFCGHLKSKHYLTYLARTCGVDEATMVTADFRKKIPGVPANQYVFEATYRDGDSCKQRHVNMKDVFAGSWGYNFLMLNACHYCDDVMAETADAAFGDAWLPGYRHDYRGTSIAVVRRRDILERFDRAVADREVTITDVPPAQVIRSQASGLKQRREGLALRLALAQRHNKWHPTKRVQPHRGVGDMTYAVVQQLRMEFRRLSYEAMLDQLPAPGLSRLKRKLYPLVVLMWSWNLWRRVKRRVGEVSRGSWPGRSSASRG
jgi:coenzyme F420-reducing hydrogenase beta subunit